MTRRLLGPVGGPLAFFLVAGLVFAGLGWVTVAALRVEESQRESARRADREKDLRVALWRLDARMLPALSVEDIRAFHEYKTYSADDPITVYGPASAPLLASELPEWMQLHFQLEPEGTWESPQVPNKATLIALRRYWRELPLRNATPARRELLTTLTKKFPARQASDSFAARERAFPQPSPSTHPLTLNDGVVEDFMEFKEERKPGPKDLPAPVNVPAPAANPASGAEAAAPFIPPASSTLTLQVPPDPLSRSQADKERKNAPQAAQAVPEPRPIIPAPDSKPADAKLYGRGMEQNRSDDYDDRQTRLGKAFGDAARLTYQLPRSQLSNGLLQNRAGATPGSGSGITGDFAGGPSASVAKRSGAEDRSFAEKKLKDLNQTAGGFAFRGSNLEFQKVESDPLGFSRLYEEAKSRERERKLMENLHLGGLRQAEKPSADGEKPAKKDESGTKRYALKGGSAAKLPAGPPGFGGILGGSGSGGGALPPGGGALPPGIGAGGGPGSTRVASGPVPMIVAPMAPALLPADAPPMKGLAVPGLGGPPPGAGLGAMPQPVPPPMPLTPDPAPAAELEPVPPPMPPAAFDEPVAPAVAVHLGSLHPHWLTAPDGTPLLVLVRTARVENRKTVYQGVVLDWSKLQTLLKEEVQDLFPDATLEPVKELTAASREQSMTALPVHLDPGPEPELPPAGWTPLRIGLVLAWVAAAIAFAAVGLTGWSLVDLAERRIRFVSAVTHELRTPLTSLRLYLDLLLSGMVQDEDKRREYLSTLNIESDRLHRLIDNVLDFAKLERSRKGRDLQAANAADLVETARLTWMDRVAADGKELVVASTVPPELEVRTDAALVQQIVGNLIDNARKYTREATDARIWLSARVEAGTRLVFEVEDRGTGVPPREQKTIFKPFRRGETADTKAGGAGLGLALSKEWAEVLGGSLTYRTPEGGTGSCFRLELPCR